MTTRRIATKWAGADVFVTSFVLVGIFLSGITHAEVALPTLFGENAVLQRDMPVPIWGTASPGETVTVQFNGQAHDATADAAGNWMVTLNPMLASAAPGDLTVKAGGVTVITLESVQIGEVWLGSGQSNMSRAISWDAERDIAIAEAASLNLSFFNVASGSPAGTEWQDSNAATADTMSAVMFWFGRHMANEQPGVPIGLIHSAVSGTAIERWSTVAGSGGLYQGQIVPLQPYAIRGVIWYQGEWDARSAKDAEKYYWQLPALIDEWRADWAPDDSPPLDFPFYVVQMPRMGIGKVHVIRDAELQTARNMDSVEMTVNIDYPEIDVHPSRKEPFGRRLADIALKTIHGHPIPAFGPVYDPARSYVAGNEIYVGFRNVGNGLVARDGPLEEWEIAGADGNYVAAHARIDGDHVVVSAVSSVPNPVSVRYAYKPAPANPNLFNTDALPASPIRELMLAPAPDGAAPVPDPMTWDSVPNAVSDTSISMTATVATDRSGVEYYFDCVDDGCSDSGWQDGTTYLDTGLQPATDYSYRVQARDKSTNQNATGFSTTEVATTLSACVPASINVASIVLSKENAGQGAKRGLAEVTVNDNCGALIEGATVFGNFTGDYYNESGSAVTDENGIAVISTFSSVKGKASFQFCVTDIASTLPYTADGANPDCKSL
jgi:sialate O-acetylesterase